MRTNTSLLVHRLSVTNRRMSVAANSVVAWEQLRGTVFLLEGLAVGEHLDSSGGTTVPGRLLLG